jgi:hypothetical protein
MKRFNGEEIHEVTNVGFVPVKRTDLFRAACNKWLLDHGLKTCDYGFSRDVTQSYAKRPRCERKQPAR